ncbi:MAG TPA: TDT family transporter [Kineosporiaceae bacterium]|nr:TDT family transporter [Kineosporiaceae bacterium]
MTLTANLFRPPMLDRAEPSVPTSGPDAVAALLGWVAPNWFAAVMGTGILATAAVGLPVDAAAAALIRPFAVAAWVVAAGLLVAVGTLTALQWLRRPELARAHHRHPVLAHFYGAPPMALMTVGAGALLLGPDLIGSAAAVRLDWVLWIAGTLFGLVTCLAVPYLLITGRLEGPTGRPAAAFGGWLMPVVPPMVSASTGALLLPHLPAGQPRLTLLVAGYALFGISLLASMIIITQIWARLTRHGLPEPRLVPTLWIVLGPLGQSVTAAILLGEHADLAIGPPWSSALRAFELLYGLPVFGFAMLWLALAAGITLRTIRDVGLPFAPTWWSFTFPVGTCVTGASGLARTTGSDALMLIAVVLFGVLLAAWAVVSTNAVRSARHRPGGATGDRHGMLGSV